MKEEFAIPCASTFSFSGFQLQEQIASLNAAMAKTKQQLADAEARAAAAESSRIALESKLAARDQTAKYNFENEFGNGFQVAEPNLFALPASRWRRAPVR